MAGQAKRFVTAQSNCLSGFASLGCRGRARHDLDDGSDRRAMNLKDHIATFPDFPKPGILFYDISTLLAHPKAWETTVERLYEAEAEQRG